MPAGRAKTSRRVPPPVSLASERRLLFRQPAASSAERPGRRHRAPDFDPRVLDPAARRFFVLLIQDDPGRKEEKW